MKEIRHGFLGKYFTYKKVGFKEVPPTTEERRQDIINKMKPWVYDPDVIKVKFAFIAGADEPEETFYLLTAEGNELQTAELDNLLWTT